MRKDTTSENWRTANWEQRKQYLDALSVKETRLLIVREALSAIDAHVLVPARSMYLRYFYGDERTLHDILRQEPGGIPVCLVAALAGSWMLLRNNPEETGTRYADASDFFQDGKYLIPIWSRAELREIEAIYEGWAQGSDRAPRDRADRAEKDLVAMLQNMLTNEGSYVPKEEGP